MDETNTLSDAEMRLITINGQTVMLEGDFKNVNMPNEFLNEMLLLNNSKVAANDGCNAQLNANSNVSSAEEINDEPTKLQITIQGENNELQTVQIGIEEAKALGLYFYGAKEDGLNLWEKCMLSGVEEQVEEDEDEVVNGHTPKENCRARLHSVPVVSVSCLDREPNVISVTEGTKANSINGSFSLSRIEKLDQVEQEDNLDNLPAIGQIEGFQIPIAENGMLLPAIANARMADGSCQTVTLIPQIINGEVMFTVHFSGDKTVKNSTNYKDHFSELISTGNIVNKETVNSEISSVEQFPQSIQLNKKEQIKNAFPESVQKLSDRTIISGFNKLLSDESIKKTLKSNNISGKDSSVNYTVQSTLPIEAKIDNLISENENVISKCKKVKYGKKLKTSDAEDSNVGTKTTKSNITKAKKVKFRNSEIKFSNEDLEDLKLKLSLLKQKQVMNKRKNKANKSSNINLVSRMNLNGRLEYPNLNAIDEAASPLTYLKVKTSHATKQPYFNVLPYPKDKTIPVQKHIFPLNCDFQQAKNIIGLQKFLETQKLQLKIQPIVSNGSKIINIRPKPTSEEVKVSSVNKSSPKETDKVSTNNVRESDVQKTQENESVKKQYQDNTKVKDVLMSDGKSNSVKFLKPEINGEGEKETNSDSSSKLNGIFIKNNPEYFSQKSKDGKTDEHPLGSSENPIQLVQTGHTFHSRQPLSETQLRQIASILQKQKFDSPNIKKNSIFDPKTNTRIVYRVVYPEDVELKDADKSSTDGNAKRKRGRHKAVKPASGEEEIQKKLLPLPRGPGRPKKNPLSALEEDVVEEEIEDPTPKKKIPRTRSGRLSRPPRYMVKDYKRLNNSDLSEKNSNSNYDSDEAYAAYENGKKVPLESTDNITDLELEANLLSGLRPQQRSKRNFKPEYRCPTCQKIYLGHTRMMWHLNKFPDHCNVEKYKENYYRKRTETKVRRAARRLNLCDVTNKVKQVLNSMSKDELTSLCGPILAEALTIWDFLLLRVNLLKASRKDEVDALLHELVILLEKLTKIAEDIFLPVFTKEAEKDEDCVEIDRMEVAIALGLPVGFYKVNNDNLNLLRLPLKDTPQDPKENEEQKEENHPKVENEALFPEKPEEKQDLFMEKPDPWDDDKNSKKLEDSFWLESKVEDSDGWHAPEVKPLSTKFEPNLSTKLLESSNDSIDLDSNSKDIEQSNSSGNMDESPEIRDRSKIPQMGEKTQDAVADEKHPELWNENSTDKVAGELWNESTELQSKAPSELWTNENSEMAPSREKPLWNENSSEKVDETNSEFLDSLLSVPNSNEFLGNETSRFLSGNISLMDDKSKSLKGTKTGDESEEKREWRNDEEQSSYWETEKNPPWQKEEGILAERMPGVRTANRLTSTPETNATMSFNLPNRRNSISDFSNINLESANLDMVLPPAKTLIKDRLKDDKRKFDMTLESSDNFKVKNWEPDTTKQDFTSTNVNSEDLMKMALESLTSQHDVISVPPSSFDSAMGILNQSQETGNLNLFTSSETDGLDFNLPLPEHLLRANFSGTNFQTTCASSFPNSESPAFLSTPNSLFETSCTNSMKFDQFEGNYTDKKSKPLDDVIEFFNTKNSFNRYENCHENESSNMTNFGFDSNSRTEFTVAPPPVEVEAPQPKKSKRVKKPTPKTGRSPKVGKKPKAKKTVDYPKSNTIESIINEALFDSCASNSKPLQIKDSSPNGNSAIPDRSDNYSLPIISESLDEVGNLDFLNQD